MGPIDLTRPLLFYVLAGILAGIVIALGLPWLWAELLKPSLIWLVL